MLESSTVYDAHRLVIGIRLYGNAGDFLRDHRVDCRIRLVEAAVSRMLALLTAVLDM
jgi:hypothetical protein